MFVKKTAQIEGDRMKGHFMDTELTKRTKDKRKGIGRLNEN